MINKKLLSFDPAAMRYVWQCVLCQWLSLLCNVAFVWALAGIVGGALGAGLAAGAWPAAFAVCMISIPLRIVCTTRASAMSDKASAGVKRTLRAKIYQKMLALGTNYSETVATSEAVMLASEGVEQIDTYFARYLPQLFYSLLAPLTLFVLLAPVHLRSALVLLVCVPLIPMSIVAVQKFAKKLLDKYWGEYTSLGDDFLENIQGLTTLKIYGADGWKHEQMNEHAERFRKITMRVLTMQLNSVTLMDLLAYGGAALGIISAVAAFAAGQLGLAGCLAIVLLAADFFLPLRLLGSYFHIAMNGMAASDKIFRLLDLSEPAHGGVSCPPGDIVCRGLRFSYEPEREILHGVDLTIPQGKFVSLVGESGCGKSTISALLMDRNKGYTGSVAIGGAELRDIEEASLMRRITYVSHQSYLFKGTVRDNLLMGKPGASDDELWSALTQVNLADFLRGEAGLDTLLSERGENLSGGQRQRLALARALLHDSPVYIFDEATSNIDVESENDIMAQIHALAGRKTVLLISHRLANVTASDEIYVLERGNIVQHGTHEALLKQGGAYAALWSAQQVLEHYGEEAAK